MGENQTNTNELVSKLALMSDAIDSLLPNAKTTILFELNPEDFDSVKKEVKGASQENDKLIKIDISGREYIFILNGLLSDEIDNS